MLLNVLSKHFSTQGALLPALHAVLLPASAHYMQHWIQGGTTRWFYERKASSRTGCYYTSEPWIKNSELTHLHEQIWTALKTLSPSFDSNTHLKGHLTCHELGIVSTYHMWRSQKNIICPDNIVCIRKFQWSFKGKETTLRYHFIKSLYLLKEQCYSR